MRQKVFKTLFDYVKVNSKFVHESKFVADSAHDSADFRSVLFKNGIVPVIAINSREHCMPSKLKALIT